MTTLRAAVLYMLSAVLLAGVGPGRIGEARAGATDFDGEWRGTAVGPGCQGPISVTVRDGVMAFTTNSGYRFSERVGEGGKADGVLRRVGNQEIGLRGQFVGDRFEGTTYMIVPGLLTACLGTFSLARAGAPPVATASSGAGAPAAPAIVAAARPVPPVSSSCRLDLPQAVSKPMTGRAAAADLKPRLIVLAVGISTYGDASLNLAYSAKDACDFARALAAQSGGLYREVVASVLLDGDATRERILDGLDWIQREASARDVTAVFMAGHGVNDAMGEYFFLSFDANLERLERTSLSQSEIRRVLSLTAGKALFFFDTCHSGQIMASRRALPPDVDRFVAALQSAEGGVIVFSASTGRQFAFEDSSWGNGAFTKALLEGLSGQADYRKDGAVSLNELDIYLSERVKELTGGRQSPTTAKPASTQDFPIAVLR